MQAGLAKLVRSRCRALKQKPVAIFRHFVPVQLLPYLIAAGRHGSVVGPGRPPAEPRSFSGPRVHGRAHECTTTSP
jgi:hypothetical protein